MHARRQGYAHALLEAATVWADEEAVDLWLYCSPHGPGGPDHRPDILQLASLYESHGFIRINTKSPDYEMVRHCKNAWES